MMYSLFSEHFSNGRAAQSEKQFHVAKRCYDKAKEAIERLLSVQESDQLVNEYAALLGRLSIVELQLGNIIAARDAVEASIQYNPTAEVRVHVCVCVCVYVCMYVCVCVCVPLIFCFFLLGI